MGRYTLLARLAAGGMGEIYLARLAGEQGFEKLLVIKRLLPELVASPEFVQMFRDEARIAARLSHANICDVYELGQADHQYFIAMQYLQGVALSTVMSAPSEGDEAVDVRLVVSLIQQACEGLHHAHEQGAVHRDVSPSNLFVTVDGVVKVLDFGIAKVVDDGNKTAKGSVKGKFAYMSPEQIRGDQVDARSDVFSLGIVLHEALTRRRMFRRSSEYLIAKAILEEDYTVVSDIAPHVPRALSDVVAAALHRDPERRTQSARELGASLRRVCGELGGVIAPPEIGAMVQRRFAGELHEQRSIYDEAVNTSVDLIPEVDAIVDIDRQTASMPADSEPAVSDTQSTRNLRALPVDDDDEPSRFGLYFALLALAVFAAVAVGYKVWSGGSIAASTDAGTTIATAPVDARNRGPVAPDPIPADAAPPDAGVVDARAPKPPRARDDVRAKPGYFSITSTPYATIYIDGSRVDDTPLIKHPLSPGRHRVRAVIEDGRQKTFSVDIRSGKQSPVRKLTW